MTTYNWTIAQLERNASDDGVVVVHWRVVAQDENYTASSYGTQSFTPDPESPDFVDFEDLTEEVVISWVKNGMDAEALEAGLTSRIEEQKAPAIIAGMPWVNESEGG